MWSNSERVVGWTPPSHGGLNPPPPLFPQNQSQIIKDNSKIIPTLIVFFKMFLGNVKVNFLAVFGGFLHTPPARPFTNTLTFVQMNSVEVVHMWTKFHLHVTYKSGVLIFQKFY